MTHNVGRVEQYLRLAAGIAAAAAMFRSEGWKRGMWGAFAASGLGTALARYCPINQAMGRGNGSQLTAGTRDAELRRQTAMSSALGSRPSGAGSQPPVTRDSDMFGRS